MKRIINTGITIISLAALLLLIMTGAAAEEGKRPEWLLDVIFLPFPGNEDLLSIDLFKDKRGRIVVRYLSSGSKKTDNLIDLATHQTLDPRTLELFPEPWTSVRNETLSAMDYLKRINYEIFILTLKGTARNIKTASLKNVGGHCNSPFGESLSFRVGEEEVASYMLLLHYDHEFRFSTQDFCYGMNGKETIAMHNIGLQPVLWAIDGNRIVLGDREKPFLIVMDSAKIGLAWLGRVKTLLFDHDGVRCYWIKTSIISDCIKMVEDELADKKYDISSSVPFEGKISVNEYIDRAITKLLNESN